MPERYTKVKYDPNTAKKGLRVFPVEIIVGKDVHYLDLTEAQELKKDLEAILYQAGW